MLASDYYATTGWTLGVSARASSVEADLGDGSYEFTTSLPSSVGGERGERITLTPAATGDYALSVDVRPAGYKRATASTTVHVVDTASTPAFTALLVGDSLTFNQTYPSQTATRISPNGTLLGTQGLTGAKHEGYGGWSWVSFTAAASPFTNGGSIDIPNYLTTLGSTPDVVVWLLFTNQVYQPSDAAYPAALAAELEAMEDLITAWPQSDHAIALPLPGNTNPVAYSGITRETYRNRNHDIKTDLIQTWAASLGVYIVPTDTSVDASTAFADAVHPSNDYASLGDSVANFLHWHAQQ